MLLLHWLCAIYRTCRIRDSIGCELSQLCQIDVQWLSDGMSVECQIDARLDVNYLNRLNYRFRATLDIGEVRAVELYLGLGLGLGLEEVFVFDSKSENRDREVEAVEAVSVA